MHQPPAPQHESPIQEKSAFESEGPGLSMSPPAFQLMASDAAPASPPEAPALQLKASGGMPGDLVSGFAASTGHDLSDVNVHYNSDKPSQVGALAYAQGNDIHLGAGQEQHLAHEAAHVVQQREGRVQATTEVAGMPVNDNKGLESEADNMGAKAMQMKAAPNAGAGSMGGYKSSALQLRANLRGAAQLKSGVAQMVVDTKFGKWFDDKYSLIDSGGMAGAEIKIRFKPKDGVDAELIGLTQSVRTMRNNAVSYPGKDPWYANRAISAADAKAIDPSERVIGSNAAETDEGTRIDQSKTNRNPLYAIEGAPAADTSLADTLPEGRDVTKGNDWGKHAFHYTEKGVLKEQDGELIDGPKLIKTPNTGQIFETTAVAIKGNQVGTYYGSVRWGWHTDAAGVPTLIPFDKLTDGMPSSTFLASVNAWNASKTEGGDETLDLPVETVFINAGSTGLFSDAEMKTKTKDLPASTRMVNRLCTIHGSYKMRIVDGPDLGTEGYVDQTKIQRER
jgi:hypothetical protein